MPRHEPVSPEEDLSSYYGTDPAPGSASGSSPAGSASPPVGTQPPPDAAGTTPPPFTGRLAPVQRPPPSFDAPVPPASEPPNPAIAAIVSLFVPGAGQIYAGQTTKGVVILIIAFGTCFGAGVLNVLAAVDALLIAQRRGRGEDVDDWQFF